MARAGPTWARLYFIPASDVDLLQRARHAPFAHGTVRRVSAPAVFHARSWQPRALPSPQRNLACVSNAVAVTRQNTGRPGNSARSRRPRPTDNAGIDDRLPPTTRPARRSRQHGNASVSCGSSRSHGGTHLSGYAPSTRGRRWHGHRRDDPRALPPRCPRSIAVRRPASDRHAPARHAE